MRRLVLAAPAVLLLLSACSSSAATHRPAPVRPGTTASSGRGVLPLSTSATTRVPHFAHIVVVVEENHGYSQVIGSAHAPYINALTRSGTLLTNAHGVRHPSEPNYVALFSGSTHGLTNDSCPHSYGSNNLGRQLRAHRMAFAAYSEGLPRAGYRGCWFGGYARKHAPWTNFTDIPATVGKPMSAFPTNYTRLPRVSFVVPDLDHDMHDGTVAQADSWLKAHLSRYATWARRHNSLLVVTWDEDDNTSSNHIPGVLVGARVRHLRYGQRVDHYRMLRTIEAACGLPALGVAAHRAPISGIWTP
jgi:acid phosphatase